MKTIFLAFLIFTVSPAWSADKNTVTSNYVSVIQKLQRLARDNHDSDPQPKLRTAIDSLLPESLSSEQLFRLGISTHLVAYPQEAGSDIPFDAVFSYASHRCASLLSLRSDSESAHFLVSMKPICGPDGGESLFYREVIARQAKLRENTKSK